MPLRIITELIFPAWMKMNSELFAINLTYHILLKWEKESLPDFIKNVTVQNLKDARLPKAPIWETLYITGGRRDKISKGDIAGLFLKQGNLTNDQLGTIEVKQDCSYVAVHASKMNELIEMVNNSKLKTKKVRVSVV